MYLNNPTHDQIDSIDVSFIENELVGRFRTDIERLSVLGTSESVHLTPYENPKLPHFQKLTLSEKIALVERVASYTLVMEQVLREDRYVVNNKKSLWRMLGRLRWRSTDDLYSSITDQDVIEIYDKQGLQLYRSFNFFPLCTYTIEEIYAVPWFELYDRDDEMTKGNIAVAMGVLEKPDMGTRPNSMPVHVVREKSKPVRRCTRIAPGIVSPLRDASGQVAGFVNSFRALESFNIALQST